MVHLSAFSDPIGHDLEITRYAGQRGRWSCKIRNVEVMQNGMLGSLYGNGKTPEEAMADYARCIAGKRIAVNAGSSGRKEYEVPVDLAGGDGSEGKSTVRVRVAVSVDARGDWCAHGGNNWTEDETLDLIEHDGADRLTWITANVPLPEPAVEIEATIDAGDRGVPTGEGKEREFNDP